MSRPSRPRLAALALVTAVALQCDAPRDSGDASAPSAEERAAFESTRSYWQRSGSTARGRFLGVPTAENPLDLWVIQEIVAEVAPDFVVDTGAGDAGVPALWALVLDQIHPKGRVVAIDAGARRRRPGSRLPAARRRIDYLSGAPTDPKILAEVRRRVFGRQVIAILDSLESGEETARTLAAYAPFVTYGSYLIVRGNRGGVAEAVAAFVAENPEFRPDRSRERFGSTDSPGGFLRRERTAAGRAAADAFRLEPGFESLFNGEDLTGWRTEDGTPLDGERLTPDGRFSAGDGVLTMNMDFGLTRLWTTREFPDDFELRLEFRARRNADSGLFLRGPQLEVRDYAVAGPFGKLERYVPGAWNRLVVTVEDDVVRATCNGEILGEPLPLPATGPLGIEADRGRMEYRRIRIRERS